MIWDSFNHFLTFIINNWLIISAIIIIFYNSYHPIRQWFINDFIIKTSEHKTKYHKDIVKLEKISLEYEKNMVMVKYRNPYRIRVYMTFKWETGRRYFIRTNFFTYNIPLSFIKGIYPKDKILGYTQQRNIITRYLKSLYEFPWEIIINSKNKRLYFLAHDPVNEISRKKIHTNWFLTNDEKLISQSIGIWDKEESIRLTGAWWMRLLLLKYICVILFLGLVWIYVRTYFIR